MAIFEISVVPIGTGSPSVRPYIMAAMEVIKKSGLPYSINPMGTCIQGDLDQAFEIIRKIHDTLIKMGCTRLVTTLKIDDRRDKNQTLEEKMAGFSP